MERSFSRPSALWITLCGLLQCFFSTSVPASPVQAAAHARRALLVHGIYDSERCMRTMKRLLEARGWQVRSISLKPNNASVPFDVMARQLDDFASASFPAGEKFDLVGFSMGGLVSRYYIQKMGGYRRVRRFVTVSAPNHGTVWAWLSGRSGVKQMRPGSPMLRDLNGDLGTLAALDYTSIYTPFDLSIVPAGSSRMPVGRNVVVWIPLHPLMVLMPGPLRAVERALE
jgi:triacylglycerol lipase